MSNKDDQSVMMSGLPSQDDKNFVVIRHLRDVNKYAVDYGRSEAVTDLVRGPRFDSLDRAIEWVERLDRTAQPKAARS